MPLNLSPLQDLYPHHEAAGLTLFTACDAELFPCDALAFAVLERSLNLIKGFRSIVENGGYSSAVGLLRMQLDNILRFNGVALTRDPHTVASQVIAGTRLSKLKDRTGAAMTDRRLVEMLQVRNPWVQQAYELASGYIHLSREHFLHFHSRCPLKEDGTRDFTIGDEEDYVSESYKESLLAGFVVVSSGVPTAVSEWSRVRHGHGTNAELKQRFSKAV